MQNDDDDDDDGDDDDHDDDRDDGEATPSSSNPSSRSVNDADASAQSRGRYAATEENVRAWNSLAQESGVSEVASRILHRARDSHWHYESTGTSSQATPLGILLAFIKEGTIQALGAGPETLAARLALVTQFSDSAIEALMSAYFSQDGDSKGPSIGPSEEVSQLVRRASDIGRLTMGKNIVEEEHLLKALLEYFNTDRALDSLRFLKTRIDFGKLKAVLVEDVAKLSPLVQAKWKEIFDAESFEASRGSDRVGGSVRIGREAADDEASLRIDDYAGAMAELFASATDQGELCFALYGQWGRGKTYLVDRVSKALRERKVGYETVKFSAWKYPNTPEAWVFLYETFAAKAFDGPFYHAIPVVFRSAIEKRGSAAFLWSYFLLATTAAPILQLIPLATTLVADLIPYVTLAGFSLMASVLIGVWKRRRELTRDYLTATRHTEKLGLQAAIGEDLRALVKGWVPLNPFAASFRWTYRVLAACVAIGCWLRLTGYVPLYNGPFFVTKAASFESAGVLALAVFAFQLGIYRWLDRGGRKKKILLVVDDLDRCNPSHLLSVVESIKLLLEEPAVAQRVQAVMLVEEEILKHAIYEKYGTLTEADRSEKLTLTYTIERLVRENAEKLFNAHLRLPPLTTGDVVELVRKFGGRATQLKARLAEVDNKMAAARARIQAVKDTENGSRRQQRWYRQPIGSGNEIGIPSSPVELDLPDPDAQSPEAARSYLDGATEEKQRLQNELESISASQTRVKWSLTNAILDDGEIDAVVRALSVPMNEYRSTVGPRAIRSFLFRYQLARLLALRLGVRFTPEVLAATIAQHYFGIEPRPTTPHGKPPPFDLTPLHLVAAQVS